MITSISVSHPPLGRILVRKSGHVRFTEEVKEWMRITNCEIQVDGLSPRFDKIWFHHQNETDFALFKLTWL